MAFIFIFLYLVNVDAYAHAHTCSRARMRAHTHARTQMPYMALVGNKVDMSHLRAVKSEKHTQVEKRKNNRKEKNDDGPVQKFVETAIAV